MSLIPSLQSPVDEHSRRTSWESHVKPILDANCLCGRPWGTCVHAPALDPTEVAWRAYKATIGITVSGRSITPQGSFATRAKARRTEAA